MLRLAAILLYLLASLPADAQMLLRGAGPGSAGGCSGASCITFTVTGPSTGAVSVASTNFTVTLGTGSFNGSQTITISDGAQGGTLTPSVGSPGTSTVVVTPANLATSFTFTYNPASTGVKSLTFSNAQGWTNAGAWPYTVTGGGAYSGPGDVVASAKVWYGLRAYTAAYAAATGNIGIFRRSSDNATCTGIANTAGNLDLTTTYCSGTTNLPTFCGASSGNCFISTLYDQSGTNACAAAPCNAVQATAAKQPQLVFNCVGSLPCLQGNFANATVLTVATTITLAQPYTLTTAAQTVALPPAQHNTTLGNTSAQTFEFQNVGSVAVISYNDGGGPTINTGLSFATWYAAVVTAATNSTILSANSVTPASTATTVSASTTWSINLMSRGDCCTLAGNLVEAGIWPVAWTSPQTTNEIANQRTYWGF